MDNSIFGRKVNDWKITSLGDIGAFAGYGGKLTHIRFYSQSLGKKADTALLQVGFGAGGEVKFDFGKMFYVIVDMFNRTRTAANAEKNYTTLICHTSFSLDDIDLANCGNIDTGISIPFGYKSGFCHASSSDGRLLFSVPASVDPTFSIMLKAEASVTAGIFLLMQNRQAAEIANSRMERELSRRPSDPLVRPAGGF